MPEARCDPPIEQPPSSSFGAGAGVALLPATVLPFVPADAELDPPLAVLPPALAVLPPALVCPPVGSGATSARAVAVAIEKDRAARILASLDIVILINPIVTKR